jgi:L-amino acid N-acyltransferase YncA
MSAETSGEIVIRDVEDGDMAAVREIYAYQVLHGVSSWEEEPPSLAEMMVRRNAVISAGYPYRVAVRDGAVIGYAYASSFRPRPAYRHTVENSVYISKHAQRTGVGQRLLTDLIEVCTRMDFRQMIAVIGDSNNAMSIDFHAKMGFRTIGTVRSIGYKFGDWLDSVYMQLPLGDGDSTPPTR